MNERCLELAESGWTVLAAGRRLAQRLQYEFARRRVRAGARAWESADILSWNAWLERCYGDSLRPSADARVLLNPAQSLCAWQRIISDSGYASRLLHPAAVARQALEAWDLLKGWRLAAPIPGRSQSEDANAFAYWAARYQRRCAAQGWQDAAGWPAELASAFASGLAAAPARVALVGFEAPEPRMLALVDALRGRGTQVEWVAPAEREPVLRAAGYADRRAEIRTAAGWLRALLAREPGTGVGIVMPDLAAVRRIIEHEFDDALLPGALIDSAGPAARPYSVALGVPLSEYPAVSCALLALELLAGRSSIDDIGSLMRSPFLEAAEAEAAGRAALDLYLRRRGGHHFDLPSLMRAVQRYQLKRGGVARWAEGLRQAAELLGSTPRVQGAADWARRFSQLLRSLGWPGPRTPDSDEYQCLQAWFDALAELSSLDALLPPLSAGAALVELRRIAAARPFQPRSGEQPVQVMGIPGAADMQFDHLWVMGLEQDAWPARAQPNPFLPIRLQRERGMPRASPEIELARARAATSALLRSAREVVLSYPRNEGERPLRPSPLIAEFLRRAPAPEPVEPPSFAWAIYASRAGDAIADARAPSCRGDEVQRGGAALFRDQAACPFRAFARHRLEARAPDPSDAGLSAAERGALVHRALQRAWEVLRDGAGLRQSGAARLEQVIEEAAGAALDWFGGRRAGALPPRFARIERERLSGLLRAWLDYERARPDFSVEACEREREVAFAGLRLRLRMDRIDRLASGGRALIDYKTGDARVSAWHGDRPDEPQLPLYALAEGPDVEAVAFAQLQPGKIAFTGLSARPGQLPGVEAVAESKGFGECGDWAGLLGAWRRVLTRLAEEFLAGDARVFPKGPQSCRQCDLHALCRVYETGFDEGSDDDS